jgi:4-amino-4-deoxy-L-arabinose transferase-like glycosyltransferase
MASRESSTASVDQQADSGAARHTRTGGARIRNSALWGFALVSSAAFAARAVGLSRSFELWVDEMLYTELAKSVSRGQWPNLFGAPFFLHPPGSFLINAAVIRIFDISGSGMSMVYDLRWVSAVLGAVTVGLAFLAVRRVASTGIAWICAVLLTFDPFVIRNNSRVFLETPATVFIMAGYIILADGLCRKRGKLSVWTLIVAGLLFGYGIFTKDYFTIMTIVPVILAGFWRHTLRWRDIGIICGAAAVPYASYLSLVSIDGLFGLWLKAKESGIERMIGLEQTTGFNAPHAPSLVSRTIDQVGQFGTSYVLLMLCPVVAVIGILSQDRSRRLIGLCAMTMAAFGIYSALFGTFEEQYGYGVMVASVLGIGVAYAELRERRPERETWLRASCIILAVLTVGLGVRTEVTPDDGFLQVRTWIQAHLPANAHVAVTDSTGQWMFASDPRFGDWPSAASMREHNANYILTQSLPNSEGYDYANPAMLEWLETHAVAVFHFFGPTNGNTVLWYVKPSLLQQAAKAGVGS